MKRPPSHDSEWQVSDELPAVEAHRLSKAATAAPGRLHSVTTGRFGASNLRCPVAFDHLRGGDDAIMPVVSIIQAWTNSAT